MLGWIAVYGRHLDFSTLQAISHLPQITLLNVTEQLVERQLLVEVVGQYDFKHNKIREVSLLRSEYCPARTLSSANCRKVGCFAAIPRSGALLAHHFERCGKTRRHWRIGCRLVNMRWNTYAYQQATHHYERALALANQPVPN